jgi:hypothetical protein
MNSPAIEAPEISSRGWWQTVKGLALLTPLLAVLWMAFISKLNHPTLSLSLAHVRAFWVWDALALASVTWVIGLIARLLRPQEAGQVSKGVLAVCLMAAVGVAIFCGLFKVSQHVVVSALPLVVAVGFYVGSWPMAGQKRAAQQLTVMVSAFFAAAVWMGLKFDGQSAVGVVARAWLSLGCAVGIWLALRTPQMERPQLHLAQECIAAYLFAAGVSLPPGIWGGEVPQLFAGDQTLVIAMVVGVNRWIRRFATLPEGVEQKLLSKLIPLTLCVALAMLHPLWNRLLPGSNLTDRRMCVVLGVSLSAMLILCGFLKKLSPTKLEIALFLCLCTPAVLLLWPGIWA